MFKVHPLKLSSSINSGSLVAYIAAFFLVFSVTTQQAQAKNPAAEAFVKRVGQSVLNVMSSSASDSAKKSKFRSLFVAHADTRRIGTAALGKYAKKIGGKRGEYDRLLKDYVVNVYYKNLKGYNGKDIKIVRSIDRGSREAQVESVFKFTNRSDVKIRWRLVKTGGGFKIFDINVAGIWLLQAQTQAFVSTISKNGGDVNSILAFMRNQIAKNK